MNKLIQHQNEIYLDTEQKVSKLEIFYHGGFVAEILGNCRVDLERGSFVIYFLSKHEELLVRYKGKLIITKINCYDENKEKVDCEKETVEDTWNKIEGAWSKLDIKWEDLNKDCKTGSHYKTLIRYTMNDTKIYKNEKNKTISATNSREFKAIEGIRRKNGVK